MIKQWISVAACAALLAPLGLPQVSAHERDGPDEQEVREIKEVREVREAREIEVREVEVREIKVRDNEDRSSGSRGNEARDREDLARDAGEKAEREQKELDKQEREAAKEAEKTEKEAAKDADNDSKSATPEAVTAWQADALLEEAADRDEAGNPVRQGEVIAFALSPDAERLLAASGYRVIRRKMLGSLGEEVVRLAVPRGRNLAAALREVRAVAPDAVTDFDHYYGLGLASGAKPKRVKSAHLPAAQSRRFPVGMIDTAVALHPVLGSARVIAWKAGDDPKAAAGHGTSVASLLAVQGADTIYSANIFRGPAAHPFTSIDILAEAIEWQLAQGVLVINMSIAGPPNALLEKMVAIAGARGRIVVAAAGNGGAAAPPVYPAALPGVVAVTAVDPDLRIYRYANHGRYIAVAAQGVGVIAARASGGYARFTGTSFAAPLVAARLALCRAGGASSPACTDRLFKSARDLGAPGYDDTYGRGYIE